MKHIEEALRVAQEARREIAAKVVALQRSEAPPGRGEAPPVAEQQVPPPVAARQAPPIDLSRIAYSRSRSIKVPREVLERARVMSGASEDPATRAYKLLRTQVLQRMEHKRWQTLAVVSPAAREGKTLTAINLGVALASSPQRTVMLVDCDWRKPRVHTYFDFKPEFDVLDYLDGTQPLSAAIVNPGIPRFCFLPCRAPVPSSSERLGSPRVAAFVEELKKRYRNRIVIFDLPPMLLTDDALSFLPHVDCVLVVVEDDRTRREELKEVLQLIGPERLLGTVLNKSSLELAGY